MREANKWLVRARTTAIWTSTAQPTAELVIVNYDVISKPSVQAAIRALDWSLLIADEAHNLKNPKAARTRAVLGGGKRGAPDHVEAIRSGTRLFLTGTPILGRPIEIHGILRSIGIPEAKNWQSFTERYCAGHQSGYGYDCTGASNLHELQERLRAQVMVRRLNSDVLKELPAKRHSLIELAADTAALKKAVAAEKSALAGIAALRAAVGKLDRSAQFEFAEISRIRHATALAKVPAVVEHLNALLDGTDESILVMAHHTDVIDGIVSGLAAAGHEAAVITGKTSDDDRQTAQDEIQLKLRRVFVGSMRACGVAITLTAASIVVFAEQDWTPGIMLQAEDRAHRIGQDHSVLVQHLVLDGTIDATMAMTVAEKGFTIEQALDTTVEAGDTEAVEVAAPVEAVEVAVTTTPDRHEYHMANPFAYFAGDNDMEVSAPPITETIEVASVTEVAVVEDAPAIEPTKPTRGRPSTGKALAVADRVRKWRAAHSVAKIELSGELAERVRASRTSRGLTTEALIAAAMDALEREPPQ